MQTALKRVLGSSTALAQFRKEHECKGIECQAYTRRVRKLEHYLGRLKKLKRLVPSARNAAIAQQRQHVTMQCQEGQLPTVNLQNVNQLLANSKSFVPVINIKSEDTADKRKLPFPANEATIHKSGIQRRIPIGDSTSRTYSMVNPLSIA